ncbi:MAG: ATP-dependent helicase C-terminal domain-containing protein [Bacteriovoracaceae bacterium]
MNLPLNPKLQLPIDEHLEMIASLIKVNDCLILKASPGSGKTTRVPPYLMNQLPGKIIVLEPRRLAAKLSAERITQEMNFTLGKEVGYAFRFEKKSSDQTKILFLTEGTFLKMLLHDPELAGVSLVILDEFHERHLETDVALAYLDYLRKTSRKDLKLLIMSATLDQDLLKTYYPEAVTHLIEAPPHPLTTFFLENRPSVLNLPLEKKVFSALEKIWDKPGDILVFVAGKRDIKKIRDYLQLSIKGDVALLELHGQLSKDEQRLVLESNPNRKIIIATNIAESSLTLPGIRIVIDSGEYREVDFHADSGLSELTTKKISRSSAIQRAGRAARLGPGVVFKLYSELDYENRPYTHKAEITRSDLSNTVLDLLSLGLKNVKELRFMELPHERSLDHAFRLLFDLGAVGDQGQLTEIGKKLAELPLPPRLARLVYETSAAFKNDILSFILEGMVGEERKYLKERIETAMRGLKCISVKKSFEEVLLTAFVDRVAKARTLQKDFLLSSGEMLKLARTTPEIDFKHDLWLILELNPSKEITKLVAIEESWLYELNPFPIKESIDVILEEKNGFLYQSEKLLLGSILLSETKSKITSPTKESKDLIRKKLGLVWNQKKNSDELNRFTFYQEFTFNKMETLPIEQWILEWSEQLVSLTEIDLKNFDHFLESEIPQYLDPGGTKPIQEFAPLTIQLSDRRTVPIHYKEKDIPYVESYIQDFYGLIQTPRLARGQVNIKVHLWGPHKRALQVTTDLMSFWKGAYVEMFKELSREYPRHHWAIEPMKAKPLLLKRHLTE